MTSRLPVILLASGALAWPVASASAISAGSQERPYCANPPDTADLRLVHGAQGREIELRVPGAYLEGCDDPGDAMTASVTWGDGSTDAATVQPTDGRQFVVVGRHTYRVFGPYPIVVTIRNGRMGIERTDTHYQAHIHPAGTLDRRAPIRTAVRRSFAGVVTAFPFVGPARLSRFAARISWGDGTSDRGRVVHHRGGLAVVGRHVWRRRPRNRRVVVTVVEQQSGAVLTIRRGLRVLPADRRG